MASPNNSIVIRPLTQLASLFSDKKPAFEAPAGYIEGVDAAKWPSPLQPVAPMGPAGTEPKAFQFYEGQNLQWTPRFDAEYSAADLKALATYPLVRICIENVKDVICDMPWQIRPRPTPGESIKENAKRAAGDKAILKATRFLERPDGQHTWDEWLRPWLDDLIVIDAPTVLVRRNFGKGTRPGGDGDLRELRVLRGDSISVYIDQNGWSPNPPSIAYAQNWWGLPLVDMTRDQCLYRPRNIAPRNTVASQLYGYSPVEQLAPELQIGIARLAFVLAYYKDGSVPGVVQVAPKGTTPEQIKEAAQWINSDIAGNLAKRRQWNIIQGFQEDGKAEQIIMTKEPLLADLYDEKHIREVAFGIGVSPQRLMKSMNRASAEQSDDAAETEGTRPYVRSVRGLMNHVLQVVMGLEEYEFVIDPVKELDMAKQAEALTAKVGKALMTPNEGREALGLDRDPTPEADKLGVITGTGFVTLEQTAQAANTAAQAAVQPGGKDGGDNAPVGKPGGAGKGADAGKSARSKPNGHDPAEDHRVPRPVNSLGFAAGAAPVAPPAVGKYSEDEARDEQGRWTEGGESSADEKEKLSKALWSWQSGSDDEGAKAEHYIQSGEPEGSEIVKGIRNETFGVTAWRGMFVENDDAILKLKTGDTLQLMPSSFSDDRKVAAKFSTGETLGMEGEKGWGGVILRVNKTADGAEPHGIMVGDRGHPAWRQENEIITGGQFTVTRVNKSKKATTLFISQKGIF